MPRLGSVLAVMSQNPLGIPSPSPLGRGLWICLCVSLVWGTYPGLACTPATASLLTTVCFLLPVTMDLTRPSSSLMPTSALPTGLTPCHPLTTVSWARPIPAVSGESHGAEPWCPLPFRLVPTAPARGVRERNQG